ncbi:hypothetical protein V8D89_004825 [Ganoderma adspersum]
MRLLNTKTGEFQWMEDPRRAHYAILSHVWAHDSEQTYQDLLELQKEPRTEGTLPSKLSDKLRRFCETALKDGFEFGWADTCCIDKTSSSELSEAINSMYTWYGYSGACYAFLHDVEPRRVGLDQSKWRSDFARSKWFTRGWTLQELIASPIVVFVSKAPGADGDEASALARVPGWEVLGSKHGLAALISSETGIDIKVLTFEKSLEDIPIARRMAWMRDRKATRLEDEAYCMMGIFGVNMQANYGEGRYAFIRIQEKILLQNPDQTIFSWGRFLDQPLTLLPPTSSSTTAPIDPSLDRRGAATISLSFLQQYLLASSPKDFDPGTSAKTDVLSREVFQERLGIPITEELYQISEVTPYGLRMHFPVLSVYPCDDHPTSATHCAILSCEDPDRGLLALLLRPRKHSTSNEFFVGTITVTERTHRMVPNLIGDSSFSDLSVSDYYRRLAYITSEQLESLRTSSTTSILNTLYQPRALPRMSIIYIPHRPPRSAIESASDWSTHEALCKMPERFEVAFSPWSREVMKLDGYHVVLGSDRLQNEPSAESGTLTRTPSSRGNIVTISNESGVYLTVQVGRCSCNLGQRSGVLGVLVSSLADVNSLERPLSSQDQHSKKHPIHIYSWTLEHGFASRQIEFYHPTKLILRLTFTSVTSPLRTNLPRYHRYLLSAELSEEERSELPQPRQLLPLNPAPSRSGARTRSNSLPLNVLDASVSPESPT